jgi:hypothetical protein
MAKRRDDLLKMQQLKAEKIPIKTVESIRSLTVTFIPLVEVKDARLKEPGQVSRVCSALRFEAKLLGIPEPVVTTINMEVDPSDRKAYGIRTDFDRGVKVAINTWCTQSIETIRAALAEKQGTAKPATASSPAGEQAAEEAPKTKEAVHAD